MMMQPEVLVPEHTQPATLDNLLQETRTFPPPAQFAAQANATAVLYDQAASDREGFGRTKPAHT